ncbi:MAG: hypothetical protein O3A63_09400 [Proteobacteria bacterium]|nr:hypothetical protein [Pseudomonadota bacterium]
MLIAESLTMRRNSGLSLPDTLIAAAIIAIAATIALPVYQSISQQSIENQIFIDTARIEMAIEKYRSDWFSLPETLQSVGLAHLNDPWGERYVYEKTATNRYRLYSQHQTTSTVREIAN